MQLIGIITFTILSYLLTIYLVREREKNDNIDIIYLQTINILLSGLLSFLFTILTFSKLLEL
jgi:hypothetical protein